MASRQTTALLATASAVLLAGSLFQGGIASAAPDPGPGPTDPSAGSQTPPPGAGVPDGPSVNKGAGARAAAAGDCRLYTWPIAQNGSNVYVRGGRFDCGNFATYQVQLRRARPVLPDVVVGTADGSGNGSVVAAGGCQGRNQYFGQTFSSTGNNIQGARGTDRKSVV